MSKGSRLPAEFDVSDCVRPGENRVAALVVSTGASLVAALDLLASAGFRPAAAVFAMLQGEAWRQRLVEAVSPHRLAVHRTAVADVTAAEEGAELPQWLRRDDLPA